MKATELRIGNYIDYTTEREIVTMQTTYEYIRLIHNGNKNFKPIPLNEEWLLNLRFISFKKGHLYYENNGFSILYAYGKWNYSPSQSITIGREIKYVHELQNLYFALTNEELTLIK